MAPVTFPKAAIAYFSLLASGAACATAEPAGLRQPMPETDTLPYRACVADGDCVRVDNGCCQCGEGALNIAVARTHEKAFRARFACSASCPEIDHDCSRGHVSCEQHVCTFRALPPRE